MTAATKAPMFTSWALTWKPRPVCPTVPAALTSGAMMLSVNALIGVRSASAITRPTATITMSPCIRKFLNPRSRPTGRSLRASSVAATMVPPPPVGADDGSISHLFRRVERRGRLGMAPRRAPTGLDDRERDPCRRRPPLRARCDRNSRDARVSIATEQAQFVSPGRQAREQGRPPPGGNRLADHAALADGDLERATTTAFTADGDLDSSLFHEPELVRDPVAGAKLDLPPLLPPVRAVGVVERHSRRGRIEGAKGH